MTIKNRLPLDAIMACMADYAEACAAEREAHSRYEDHSWDYHGRHYFEAIDEAKEACEKELEAYIQSCAQADLSNQWRPIETAPKDEIRVLLFRPGYRESIKVCWYSKEEQNWCYADGLIFHNATHWMPLPKPPV